jgi:hypothetical protein
MAILRWRAAATFLMKELRRLSPGLVSTLGAEDLAAEFPLGLLAAGGKGRTEPGSCIEHRCRDCGIHDAESPGVGVGALGTAGGFAA